MERRREEATSTKGETISSSALDFGQEGVATELADETADATTTATGIVGDGGRGGPELFLEVLVGETVDEVSAGEDRLEEVGVRASDGVEA
jgi:hypothetical protein